MIGRIQKRLRSESGMSMAEVMIASLILAASSLAVLNLVASGARTNYRAEQSQVVSDRLQSEMEKVKQLADNANYERIALSSAPAHSVDVNNPDYRVSGTSYNVAANGSELQAMVIGGAGDVSPTDHFTVGDVGFTIHRFVTWEPDSACTDCKKRVIVAIQLDATPSGGIRHYQDLQAVIADPRAPARDTSPPPPPPDAKPWSFWLTDTPCNYGDRQPLAGNHGSHNTRATCDTGLRTVGNCSTALGITTCQGGAPDLMITHPPQNSTPEPLYNFATDVVAQSVSQDQGLRLMKPATDGCPALDAPAVSDAVNPFRFREIHKWVSPPIPNGFNVQLDGNGTLDLWTKTVGNQAYPGRICIWLFQRQLDALGAPVDTPAANVDLNNLAYFSYSKDPWPTGSKWQEVAVPLHFDLNVLAPGSQVGVAIQVEKAGTSGGGLQFYYDEPSYESRLELQSSSLLPCDVDPWPNC